LLSPQHGNDENGRISRRVTDKAGKIVCLCRARQSNDLLRVLCPLRGGAFGQIPRLVEGDQRNDDKDDVSGVGLTVPSKQRLLLPVKPTPNKNKSKGTKGPYTSLAGHARDKSRLVSPINSLRRLQMIDWFRDLLPEHLWIDLLAQGFGESGCLPMFNRLLDRLQAAAGDGPVFHGYISEFSLFPKDKRTAFMEAN
jgi:hypothetical protein